jgi:hypothetical protein
MVYFADVARSMRSVSLAGRFEPRRDREGRATLGALRPLPPFRSREEHIFEKMLSALRFGFGGHSKGKEPIHPKPKPEEAPGHSTAQNSAE